MLKQLDIQVNEPTNQNSIKVVEPTNNTTKEDFLLRKHCYKIWGLVY